MSKYIDIMIIVNCIAAIHGIFLSFILITKKNNHRANHVLALMVLLFSIGIISPLYVTTGLYIKLWWLSPFLISLNFSFAPLLYFYVKALIKPWDRFSWKYLLHALPFVFAAIYYSSIYFKPASMRQLFLYDIYFEHSLASKISVVSNLAQPLIYILLSIRLFKSHSQKIKESYSDLEKVNLSWIRHLVVLIIIIWIITLGLQSFLPVELTDVKLDDAITFFLLSLFIFTIGYRGLSQPEIFDLRIKEQQDHLKPLKADKYKKTGLSQEQSISIKNRLIKMMKGKHLYKNPTLTLPLVAEKMDLSVHQLSQVINDKINLNFYQFINSYRVREAEKQLEDSNTYDNKLIKIAFDSGFNSLSTFNRVFKEINGESPSRYRERIYRAKSDNLS